MGKNVKKSYLFSDHHTRSEFVCPYVHRVGTNHILRIYISFLSVYIQHSERQQLGLERRFFKYSEIQGEREKMAN